MSERVCGGGITRDGDGWMVRQHADGVDIRLADDAHTLVRLSPAEAKRMRTALALAVVEAEK